MLASHPYNLWPLHVKLFTKQAAKFWDDIQSVPVPPGLYCSVELEGVDGKSGVTGSGRSAPIDVKDGQLEILHF